MNLCADDQEPFVGYHTPSFEEIGSGDNAGPICADAAISRGGTAIEFDPNTGLCTFAMGTQPARETFLFVQQCQRPPMDFEALGITSTQMAFVWSWGVAAVLGLWAIGYAISAATTAIRKA